MNSNEGMNRSRRLSAAVGSSVNSAEKSNQSFILKRGMGDTVKPSWPDHPTIFRILPGLNPDNPQEFDPWRFSTRTDDFGQWFYPVDLAMVSCEANNKATRSWVMRDPFDNGYDMSRNPLVLMRNAVRSAITQKQPFAINWLSLTQGGAGRGPDLSPPKECWLVQCVVMEHGGKTYDIPRGFGPDDKTVFLVLTTSAVQAIKRAMEQRVPEFRGDPNDIAGHFVNGDPVSLTDGAYFVLFNREKDPRSEISRAGGFSAFNRSGPKQEVKGYDAYMMKDYKGGSAQLADFEDIVRGKVKAWHEAVSVPTDEEQVKFLEQVYRPFSDLLVYALDDAYGRVLDPGIRREGLIKLGRMAPEPVPQASAYVPPPASPFPAAVPVSAPSPVGGSPFARAASASRSSESIDPPTSTRGISEPPEAPTVRNNLSTQEDSASAVELVKRIRMESMRGSSVPRPSGPN